MKALPWMTLCIDRIVVGVEDEMGKNKLTNYTPFKDSCELMVTDLASAEMIGMRPMRL